MKKSAVFIIFSLVLCQCFLTLSCQVGLGDAVDTEAPQFEITNPPINSIIRGDFNIQGSFSDDGEIDFVDVVLESTTYKDQKYSYKGTFDAESGTWKNLVSPVSNGIKDGPYQISVTMEDKAGHKTVQTRQITVDNTAPVIVLQRPSSVSSATSDIDGYGQKFTLTGQAADDNNVSLIELSVYSDPDRKNLLTTIPLTNVPPTIELDAAEFKEGIDNTYSKIYQSKTKVGPKKLYCSLKAYDGAQSYPTDGSNQTPEDLKGNCTSYYYLYEQISSSVLSTYKVTDLYKMFSGNYQSNEATKSATDIVASVQKLLADKKITAGSFTLNPANNPSFTVSGRDSLLKDGTDFVSTNASNVLTNGTASVIEVSCGLDAIPLDAESLRVYVQECDDNGIVLPGAPKIYPSDSAKSKSGTSYKFVVKCSKTDGLEFGHKYIFGVDGKDEKDNSVISSGNGYGFRLVSNGAAPVLTVNSPLSTINYLKKGASQEISGFIVLEDGVPEISITNNVTINGASNNYDVYYKAFTAAEGEDSPTGKKYSFSCVVPAGNGGFNQDSSSQNAFTITASADGMPTTVSKTVMYDVDGPSVSLDSMLPTAYKYLDDESGNTDGKEYLNGDVTLKLSISDEYDTVDTSTNRPFIEIVDGSGNQLAFKVGDETVASTVHYITNPTKQTFIIHTADIPNQTVRLRIYAWDRAGNCYVDSANGNTYLEKTYMIDQETDKPVILPNSNSSVSLKYDTHEARDAGNKSSFPSGGQLLLKLIDDDGIKNVKVYRATETAVATGDIESSSYLIDNPVDYSNFPTEMVYTHVLPSEAAYYRVKVVVTDKYDNKKSLGPFFIRVTAAAPSLLTVTASPSVVSTASAALLAPGSATEFTNAVEISGTEAPFYVFRKKGSDFINNDIPSVKPSVDVNDDFTSPLSLGANVVYAGKTSSTVYDDRIIPANGDGNTVWYYKIFDKNWNATNTKGVTDYIDSSAPSVTITSPAAVTSGYATSISGSSYYFSGTAADPDASANQKKSGVSKILYAIVKNEASNSQPAAPANGDAWTSVNASSEWSVNKQLESGTSGSDAGKLYEGHYWLFVKSVDAAGNMTVSPAVREFYVDMALPSIETKLDDVLFDSTSTQAKTQNYTFKYKVGDSYGLDSTNPFGIKIYRNNVLIGTTLSSTDVYYSIGDEDADGFKEIVIHKPVGADDSYSLDGLYEYSINAKDKVGKETSVTRNVRLDTKAPVLEIVSPVLSESGNPVYQNSANVIIKGSAEDDSGTDAVYYAYAVASEPSKPSASDTLTLSAWTALGWKKAFGTTSWKISGDLDAADCDTGFGTGLVGEQGTSKNLYIVAVDKNGIVCAVKSEVLLVDTASPTFKNCYIKKTTDVSGSKPSSLVTNGDFFISGQIWDANGIKSVKITSGSDVWTTEDTPCLIYIAGGNKEDAKSEETAVLYTREFVVGSANSSDEKYIADGERDFTIEITDAADKVSTGTVKVTIDTVNPTVSFNPTEFNPVVKETIDSKPWYNKSSVKFVVTVNETNVSTVEATTDSVNYQAFSLVSGTENKYQGSVALAEDSNTVTVKVTDTAGNSGSAETTVYVDTVVPQTIRAFDDNGTPLTGTVLTNGQAPKTIYLEANDGFTPKAVTGADTGGSEPSDWPTGFFTDYDCTIPVAAGTAYVPANTYYKVSGQTGIKSFTLENTTVSTKVASGVNTGRYELSVPVSKQSGSLNITVKDTLENSARLSPFSYKLDNTAPRISLSTPSVAAATAGVNGSVTIAGVVNDGLTVDTGIDGQLKKITVEYSLADQVAANTVAPVGANDWYQINDDDTINCTLGQESFNIIHDFSSLTQILGVNTSANKIELQDDSTTASKYVWIKITAEDTAGWTSVKTQKVLIDRDADRPVIKLTSMALGTGMGSEAESRIPYENSELSGTISDDDGIPLGLEYKIGSGGNWNTSGLSYSTSDGLFTLSLNDGVQDVYFRIKEVTSTAANEVYFESKATGAYALNSPKLTDKSNNEYGYKNATGTRLNTVIYAKVDTQAPFVDTPEFTRNPAEASPVWSSSISGAVFGGTKNTLYLRQYAYDVNGVKGVYLSIPKDDGDGISTAVTAWSYTDSTTKVKTTYYTSGSNPSASSNYWNTYKFIPGTTAATGTISSVTKNDETNVTDSITIGGVVYTKESYIFELYETADTKSIGGNTYSLWTSYASATQYLEINVANLVTSNRSASLIATDGIKSASTPVTLVIDNTAPNITFNGPATSGSVTGSVTGYGSIDSTGTVYYAISPSGTVSPDAGAVSKYYDDAGVEHPITGNGGSCSPTYSGHQIKDASISWFVYFDADDIERDSENSPDQKTHGFLLNNYLVDYGITTSEALAETGAGQFDTVVKLYLWIKAVDESGNIKEECRAFNLDPQGDRPIVQYSYPTTDGDVFGGEIRLTGSATDDEGNNPGVKTVWAQVISTSHTLHQTFGELVPPATEPPLLTDPDGWASKTFGAFELNASKQVTSLSVTQADLDYMKAAGYLLYDMKNYDASNPSASEYTGSIPSGKTVSDYGIKCTLNGSSWSLSINSREELNVAVGTNGVVVRIKALDKDNKFSTNVDKYMVFDAQNPVIGNSQPLYLIQSASNSIGGTGDSPNFGATASKEYKDNMFVRDTWYLIGSVEDNDKIKELKIGNDVLMSSGSIQSNATKWDVKISSDGKKVFFKYKLNTATGVDKLIFDVYTEDGATPTAGKTRKSLNIAYDNIAPVLANVKDSAYNISPQVKQSDGFYTFGSKVSEDSTAERKNQSGLDFVAFYFMRRNTVGGAGAEVDSIYDPMIKPSPSTPNVTTVSSSTPDMSASGSEADGTIVYKNGLYWITKSVTASGSNLDFTTDRYIKNNGLVMAGGSLYKITDVSSSSVTLNSNVPSTVTKAYFALAMLVDNKTRESGGNDKNAQGYPSTVYNDDGDGMVEYVKESDGTWSADIVSKNIPDGPIELHYVAFDAAGNYSIGIMGNHSENDFATSTGLNNTPDRKEYISLKTNPNRTSNVLYVDGGDEKAYMNGGAAVSIDNTNLKGAAFIANNAPRLAALKIWTNYNDDAVEDDDEIKWYYCSGEQVLIGGIGQTRAKQITDYLIVSGNSADYSNSGTPFMTIKGKTSFTPEIVGGNGSLYYQSRIGDASTVGSKTWSALSDAFVTGNGSSDNYMDATGTYVDTGTDKLRRGTIEITPAIIEANCKNAAGTGTNGTYWFDYKIWDSTEGTLIGTDSLSAKMCVALDVQYFDVTPPNVVMKPLYWKSNTDNSIYKRANNDNKLEGHIELAQDLAETTLGTGFGSSDDKISGKVIFSGYAYDNKSLKKLDWNILSSDGTATLMSGTGATLSGATWSSSATMAANHYEFKVYSSVDTTKGITADDVYRNGNGHKVAWELAVDTSYIDGIVAENAKVQIIAYDASGTGGEAGLSNSITVNEPPASLTDLIQIDKQKNVPSYQVDIMPYITDVITRLAGKDKVTPVIYSRTAKGHYPIASSETLITLKGYNLAENGADVTINPSTLITASGLYNYSVNGITAVNNINNNNAHGDYDISDAELSAEAKAKNMYNMTPNTSTNLNLTDDIYFDVWEINSNAATSGAALKYPVMHINPTNGQIGFGFVKGGDSVSFPANGASYTWYQKNRKDYVSTNFVYDTKGVAHTISIGLDAQWDTGIAGRMNYNNSTWWAATTYSWGQINGGNNGKDLIKQWDKTYNIALESIGIPNGIYVKGQAVDAAGGKGIIDIERFSTPSIATSTHGNNTAIYIMYYDADHDQIRFRYGEVPNNATSRNGGNYGLLNDSVSEGYNGVDNTGINSDTSLQNDSWGDHDMFEAHRGYYALVTGDYYKQKNDGLTGTDGELLTSTGNYGSEYNALDVVPGETMNDDKVVMIWYDQSNNNLMYAYRYNLGTNDTASNADASSSGVENKWSVPRVIHEGAVQDCVIKVDSLNGIHIAFYDQNNADLRYIYMPSYNSANVYSCTVDGYSQVGSKITIDTALNAAGTKAIPYISYYAEGLSALPKVAFLPNGVSASTAATDVKEGVNSSNQFTGDWEVSMVPTSSSLQKYNVNVGLFKTDGKLDSTKTGTNVVTDNNERKLYGNGTSHVVVGYAIRTSGVGYIETAMYKGVPEY